MAKSSDAIVKDLQTAVNIHCEKNRGKYLDECIAATEILMVWMGYLHVTVSKTVADRLLNAAQATIIEVAGSISLGLVRPAIFSIRSQLELLLAWVYFNDHPVEWNNFEKTGRDFPMRAVIVKYLHANGDRFSDRLKILNKVRARKEEDPYGLLSIYVHSISAAAGPLVGQLSTIVQNDDRCRECVTLQKEVAEYLTDILAAWYADRWLDFPPAIKAHLQKRLLPAQLKEFCRT